MGAPATSTGSATSYTRDMAAYVAGLRYEDIPAEVIERIKLLILDSFGCALYGASLEWSSIMIDALRTVDKTETCSVWGTATCLSAPHAILVNGMLIQSFELDDYHTHGLVHNGSTVLPPLIALAEEARMSGRDFLTASVAGYEVGPRVGICMGQQHLVQGWHTAATIGVFGAVASTSVALRLDPAAAMHALGMAATQASGLMAAQFGSMAKRMHAGRASQSGYYAALLAKSGFTGIDDVFDREYGGFCTTFSGSRDKFNLAALTEGLGTQHEVMNCSLKFYSCAASNHAAIDALRTIRARRPFAPADVARIVVHGSEAMKKHVFWKYEPGAITTAQFNMQFVLATFLLEDDVFVTQFTERTIADPARLALAAKVDFEVDPEITAAGATLRHKARVEVFFTDGSKEEETVTAARGNRANFASADDVVEKFMKLSVAAIPAAQARQIVDQVMALDRADDARALALLLRKASTTKSRARAQAMSGVN